MAMSIDTLASSWNFHVDAAQTVTPAKVTEPRQTQRVFVSNPHCPDNLQRRIHILLCYNKVTDDDCGRLVAGWMKESLSEALSEKPMLGGRLRRTGDGELELVSIDSGVRIVEAMIGITVSEFLDSTEKKDIEAQLVFWTDIDEQNPIFSPLFYLQVTNFKCGGYSIGISCSLLLANPLVMTSFLKRWTHIHKKIVSRTDIPKIPMFYLPNFKRTSHPVPLTSSSNNSNCKTILFKRATTADVKTITSTCVGEAERKLGREIAAAGYSLMMNEPSGDIKVEYYGKGELILSPESFGNAVDSASWDELRANEVAFREGNKAVDVSYWIECAPDAGLLLVMPSFNDEGILGMTISVTIPIKKL